MSCAPLMALLLTASAPAPHPHAVPAVLEDTHFKPDAVSRLMVSVHVRGLTGMEVLRDVVARPEVKGCVTLRKQANPLSWLMRNLQVKEDERGRLRVSLKGCPPGEQVTIVNAVVAVHLADAGRLRWLELQELKYMQSELARTDRMLRSSGFTVDYTSRMRGQIAARATALKKGTGLRLVAKARR